MCLMHTYSMEAADGVVAGTADDASFRHVLEEPAEIVRNVDGGLEPRTLNPKS